MKNVLYYACDCLFLHGRDRAFDSNAKVKFLTFISIFLLDTIEQFTLGIHCVTCEVNTCPIKFCGGLPF